ncbi:TPA: IS110 family transposase [Vibrio parahaemolyticus]
MKNTVIGVDLAKDVIQVCIYSNQKVHSNFEVTQKEFTTWLANREASVIVFEACGTSNYWKQVALSFNHDAKLISPSLVSSIRQNQKTDKNDALAIVQASLLPDVQFISGKNFNQQQMQSIVRFRELAVKQRTAAKNQLKALLAEFNIRPNKRYGGLRETIENALESVENSFSDAFRKALSVAWELYLQLNDTIKEYDQCIEAVIESEKECKKLLRLEGVGPLNAINLYISIGCAEMGVFKKGKDAAACIGLTPVQHSSGGKTVIGKIKHRSKNQTFRNQLISGAMAIINVMDKREPTTTKERWLKSLVDRKGKKCAAVALANKNVRTAFALLMQGTEYKATPVT